MPLSGPSSGSQSSADVCVIEARTSKGDANSFGMTAINCRMMLRPVVTVEPKTLASLAAWRTAGAVLPLPGQHALVRPRAALSGCALDSLQPLVSKQPGLVELPGQVRLPRPHLVVFAFIHPQWHQFQIGDHVV